MRIYGYLRASTEEQDANRAKSELSDFAKEKDLTIAAWFIENESGAILNRPELFRLLEIAQSGDVLLVEQIDRISRLRHDDWEELKSIITNKGIRIVSLDLPTSHQLMQTGDESPTSGFTQRMLSAINGMMLDMLAAVARKDYDDRRRRQSQGVQKAKQEDKYKGRPDNIKLQSQIESLLRDGKSYSYIMDLLKCGRATIAKVSKKMKDE